MRTCAGAYLSLVQETGKRLYWCVCMTTPTAGNCHENVVNTVLRYAVNPTAVCKGVPHE